MPIDIRAKVYCSLGNTVISGNVSDSYLQGAGLVKTTGQVVLSGIYTPTIGQDVRFGYYQNGVLAGIPRALRVLSSFADPFRNETTVELGDVLVYNENRKPPLKSPSATEENPDIPCAVLAQAIIPISAGYVFNECLAAIGITSTGANLTNKFSVDEFDMSSGYISVIDQLLVSENQFGYINEEEVLVVVDYNTAGGGTGPVFRDDDLIDVASIGSGELPGDAVAVNYSSLRLKPPDELESVESQAGKNWEYEFETTVNSDTKIDTYNNLSIRTYSFKNYEKRETVNTYDSWNRKVKALTTIKKSIIVANPAYVESAYSFNLVNVWDSEFTKKYVASFKAGVNTIEVTEKEERYWKYTTKAVGGTTGCRYQEASDKGDIGAVKEEEYYLYQSKMGVAGAMNIPSYYYGYFGSSTSPVRLFTPESSSANILTRKQLIEYEAVPITTTKQKIDGKKTDVESETTKTVTTDWVAQLFTKEGQQMYAQLASRNIRYGEQPGADLPGDFDTLLKRASILVVENKRTENYYGANFGLQVRPTAAERSNAANSKEDSTESVSEIEWVTGSDQSTNVITFDLPYAPDDEITWSAAIGFRSKPSNAASKARAYGDVQNRLLYGNRYGINMQISPAILPSRPFDPIYLNATGIMGQYRVNGTNWAFDSEGIVASIDALFWGAVGSS